MIPKTKEEYEKRFKSNQRIFGAGVDTGMEIPCMFCGAPKFMIYTIIEVESVMTKEHTCKECGRSAKFVITTLIGGGKTIEPVQTGGDDAPGYLQPPIRRV